MTKNLYSAESGLGLVALIWRATKRIILKILSNLINKMTQS